MGNLCASNAAAQPVERPDQVKKEPMPQLDRGPPNNAEPMENEYSEIAWALEKPDGKFTPIKIPRGNCGEFDVKFEMLFCGVCHSDVHIGREDLRPGSTKYPFVGGHELLGKVVEVGSKVTRVKVDDHCAVGCLVDSCQKCEHCQSGEEQYCAVGGTTTYNGERKHGRVPGNQNLRTYGGYSGSQVTHEKFIVKIPLGMELERTAPILCAGITMWDPLRHWGFTKPQNGKKTIGIVGVGGLGTMGIKLAKALGHDVVAISSSDKKEKLAFEKGATHFVNMKSEESRKACAKKCNIILNTVSASHDLNVYLPLLATSGILVQIGACITPHPVNQVGLMYQRQSISGSIIGGIDNTQEVINFCRQHDVYPDCETIDAKDLDMVWEKLLKGDADGLRYVIDIKKSLESVNI